MNGVVVNGLGRYLLVWWKSRCSLFQKFSFKIKTKIAGINYLHYVTNHERVTGLVVNGVGFHTGLLGFKSRLSLWTKVAKRENLYTLFPKIPRCNS